MEEDLGGGVKDLWDLPKNELIRLLYAYRTAIDESLISSITDLKGNILYVNKRFCEVSKCAPWELIGQNHRVINSGYHPKAFFKDMWQTISNGEVWKGEVKNKAKDGSYYWVDTVIMPVKNENGNPNQYLSLRLLIDDRKEMEKEREEFTSNITEMLKFTSHKVRKPVASCIGLMNIVENSEMSQEELTRTLTYFKQSAVELDEFTRELTEYIHKMEQRLKKIDHLN